MAKLNCVTVLAPAKLNLALDVVGLLPNGYHNLDMTMQAITLYERVVLRRSRTEPDPAGQPGGRQRFQHGHQGGAGLLPLHRPAGGCRDHHLQECAGACRYGGRQRRCRRCAGGPERLYGAKLSMSELCALGAKIGADVPFALMGGTCRVQGVGDVMKALPPCPDCWFTVVMPDYGVSTPEAFAAYDKVGSSTHPDCEAQEKAIRAGDLAGVCP